MTLLITFILFIVSCKDNDSPDPQDPNIKGAARVWLTSGDKTRLLNREQDLQITNNDTSSFPVIMVDSTIQFQTMHGFGAALTGSSAFLLNKELTPSQRADVIEDLFDRENGIGISYVRLTMGASDFSLSDFTYDDQPIGSTDFALEDFSLSRDLEDVVPVLKEILQTSPDLNLMGSPWTPPAWMKTSNHVKGGQLKPNCYSVYADYFVKYIQAMAGQGITITSVTPQNEPLYFTAGYPCMEMQASEQLDFIKNHLGPKFTSAGITTKIIVYDHNWDVTDYAISILNDPVASQYIAGSAFHAYAGDVSAMSTVHNTHPEKELYFTEVSGGAWATNFKDNLLWNMQNIFIGTAKNWSTTSMMWNLALDQHYGPQNHGCSNCRGVITVNTNSGGITFNEEYYSIGHFSKFVHPGAKRISSGSPAGLTDVGIVAFLNPDGSKAMVVANYSTVNKPFTVKQAEGYFHYVISPQSVATIVW
jgi:glucosylceramidase